MNNFAIVSDSCCDLDKGMREEYGIGYVPMYVSASGGSAPASLDWEKYSAKEFYDYMRAGERVFTSQATAEDYTECFSRYLEQGRDVLSISCSSALSASVKASFVARDELSKKYPGAKIICIDSLISSGGMALLCMLASRLRAEGRSIEETAREVESAKMYIHQFGTVDELKYLKMSGRISASKALFGTLLSVKPVIISNKEGENVSVAKAKGRIKAIRALADGVKENYTGSVIPEIFITHADCAEDADRLKDYITEDLPGSKIHIGFLNPIVGASCGPKMLAVYFSGKDKPDTADM